MQPQLPVSSADRSEAAQFAVDALQQNLEVQANFCARLEAIADALPDQIDRQTCLETARTLYPVIKALHEFEEGHIFPLLRESGALNIDSTIERLRFEHWEDESFAAELQESLCAFASDRDGPTPDSLAYMLRGFFECMRRHVAFEREHLLPILKSLLQ